MAAAISQNPFRTDDSVFAQNKQRLLMAVSARSGLTSAFRPRRKAGLGQQAIWTMSGKRRHSGPSDGPHDLLKAAVSGRSLHVSAARAQ